MIELKIRSNTIKCFFAIEEATRRLYASKRLQSRISTKFTYYIICRRLKKDAYVIAIRNVNKNMIIYKQVFKTRTAKKEDKIKVSVTTIYQH